MKLTLYQKWYDRVLCTMKIATIQLMISTILGSMALANSSKGQGLLELEITTTAEELELRQILERVERFALAKFAYSRSTIERDNGKGSLDIAAIQVSGMVSDETGAGLPGVNILEKGTSNGTTTDASGKYTLSVQSENSIIVFSFIGYAPEEIVVGTQNTVNVSLSPDIKALQEIVVIGYGEKERKDISGAIADIKATDIQKTASLSPQMAMQGRMPGVFVSAAGGDPNARPTVRIRGVTTFGNNANPLYIIDGVAVQEWGEGTTYTVPSARANDFRGSQNIFNLINPDDIESISVLKDASAAAVYGVRGANGVIIITTKRGKEGKPRLNFNAYKGVQNVNKTFDVLNTPQYTSLYQDAFNNNKNFNQGASGNRATVKFFDPADPAYLGNSPTYDWQDELLNKNAAIENYNLSLSGGTQAFSYTVSAGYANQESTIKFNDQQRYTFGVNTDFKIAKWLEVGESFRFAYTDMLDDRSSTGVALDLRTGALAPPWQPLYDDLQPDGLANTNMALTGPESEFNFIGIAKYTDRNFDIVRPLGSLYATVIPVKNLRIKGSVSADYIRNKRSSWSKNVPLQRFKTDVAASQGNRYGELTTENINLTKELSVNYNRSFGNHNFDALFVAYDQRTDFTGLEAGVNNIRTEDVTAFSISTGNPVTVTSTQFKESTTLQGYTGRLSYKYNDKYYLDFTYMRNGSSRFAPEFRWGNFPAVAGAWRISGENFFKNIDFVSDLKIRGSWGELGNQDTRAFAYLSLVNINPQYTTGSTGSVGSGVPNTAAFLGEFANRQLSWEKVISTNAGFDAALFNNALTVTFDYYDRRTEGILQSVSFPPSAGINTQPVFNIADVANRGIELAVNYRGVAGDFQYSIGGNFTTVHNEVTKLYGGQPINGSETNAGAGVNTRIIEGRPINSIYGYVTDGIFQNQSEVDEWLANYVSPGNTSQLSPGDIRFRDIYSGPNYTGSPDGIVDGNDQAYIGKTIPGYYYGVNLGATYKNFDLSLLFQGVGDVQRHNVMRSYGESMSGRGNNQLASTLDRWTESNPGSTMPRAVFEDPSRNNRFSDRWIEDAGFLRLNNAQLGYSFPKNILNKTNVIEGLRIYLQSNYTFVITEYSGLDPENDFNPNPRAFLIGLNANF